MVLQGSRSVSDYQRSFIPVFSSVVQVNRGLLFKSIKYTLFLCLQYAVANGLERSLRISTLLKCYTK